VFLKREKMKYKNNPATCSSSSNLMEIVTKDGTVTTASGQQLWQYEALQGSQLYLC